MTPLLRRVLTAIALGLSAVVLADEKTQGLWVRQQLGEVETADLVTVTANDIPEPRLVVTTTAPALASLALADGSVQWRQLLPSNEIITKTLLSPNKNRIFTLSNGRICRSWRLSDGRLQWEDGNSASSLPNDEFGGDVIFLPHESKHEEQLLILNANHLVFRSTKGQTFWKHAPDAEGDVTFRRIATDKSGSRAYLLGHKPKGDAVMEVVDVNRGSLVARHELGFKCFTFAVQGQTVSCSPDNSHLNYFEVSGDDAVKTPGNTVFKESVSFMEHSRSPMLGARSIDGKTFFVRDKSLEWDIVKAVVGIGGRIHGSLLNLDEGSKSNSREVSLGWNGEPNKATMKITYDSTSLKGHGPARAIFPLRDSKDNKGVLVQGADLSISCYVYNKGADPIWTREEGMANPIAVQIIGMNKALLTNACDPADRTCQTRDPKLLFTKANAISRFMDDLQYAARLANDAIETGLGLYGSKGFGFKKLALIWSKSGKLYGMETDSGKILFSKFLEDPLSDLTTYPVAMHVIDDDNVLFLMDDDENNTKTILVNAQTGDVLQADTSADLDNISLLTSFPVPRKDPNAPKTFVLVNEEYKASVWPSSQKNALLAEGRIGNFFFHVADKNTGVLRGFRLNSHEGKFRAEEYWSMVFDPEREKIETIVGRPEGQILSSTLKILEEEDTVLYKWLNPHLLVVMTSSKETDGRAIAPSAVQEAHVTAYLVDSVTGRVYHRLVHKNGAGPCAAIQVENRVLYHFMNEQSGEPEIVVHDLWVDTEEYGTNQPPTFSAFSAHTPILESQAFNYIRPVVNFQMTRTRHGIAHKVVLAVLSNGDVLRVDPNMVDPRRPIDRQPTKAEKMAGLQPYARHLPSNPTLMINQQHRLAGVEGVVSSSSELESTSIILGYGTDIFFRRLTPTKAFDMLSPDFDYVSLFGVVGGVSIGIYFAGRYAETSAINTAWKVK